MDNEIARKILKEYIEKYDMSNPRIALKASHIYRVADVAKKIVTELDLTEEQIWLAELIGLLHDIGRFEQLRIYDTFNDRESINHATLGIQILEKDNLLSQFCPNEKYHNIIIRAIENHNKFRIDEGLEGEELLQSKIIRDSDKVDILNLLRFETFDTIYKKSEIIDEPISKVVIDAFLEGKQVDRALQVTCMDDWIGSIGLIFDINFIPSLKIIRDNNYINELIDKTPTQEMEIIREYANKYIGEGIKNGR